MRKKLIVIFVCMLMITTVVPISGTLQESEQKNSMFNQNNNIELLSGSNLNYEFIKHHIRINFAYGIGFIKNRTKGELGYHFNCIFFLVIEHNWDDVPLIKLYRHGEPYAPSWLFHNHIGKHFAFFHYFKILIYP